MVSRAESFFNDVYAAFLTAAPDVREYRYRIAGIPVAQRFAGDALEPVLMPALRHLRADDAPELTVCLWDSASTGVALPPIPWEHYNNVFSWEYGTQGEIRSFNDQRFGVIHNRWLNYLHLVDRARGLAICWYDNAATLPYWECTFPLRTVLHLYTRDANVQLMHSASVGTPAGGVLLAGRSGSGKSTTALACLGSQLLYAGDDYTAVQLGDQPYVHSLYSVAKLVNDNLERFPHLQPRIHNQERAEDEKAILLLNDADGTTAGFPLKAIFMPQVTGRHDTRLIEGSKAAALLALAPTSLFQLVGAKAISFRKMRDLVRQLPVYTLEVGTDLRQIPATILEFLS